MGEHALGKLLVLSQVVLSLQLPFVLYPLTRWTNSAVVMGTFQNGPVAPLVGWGLFLGITGANLLLLADLIGGRYGRFAARSPRRQADRGVDTDFAQLDEKTR